MLKHHKKLISKLNDLGVEADVMVSSNHSKLLLSYKGQKWTYFCSTTPSDRRGEMNLLSDIKKWIRRVENGQGLQSST